MTLPLRSALRCSHEATQQCALHLHGRFELRNLFAELPRLPRRALARLWLVLCVAPSRGRGARAHERRRRERVDGLRVKDFLAGYLLVGREDVGGARICGARGAPGSLSSSPRLD